MWFIHPLFRRYTALTEPLTMGHEIFGEVVAIGEEVSSIPVGISVIPRPVMATALFIGCFMLAVSKRIP
jgi:D-arabinose 1-dehydrogenase-like Zn-dependent alcohol dehydrogenase